MLVALPLPQDADDARARVLPVADRDAARAAEAARPVDFLALYDELFPVVWRLARRLGVPESSLDDVCQEVFVVVHARLVEFEGRSSLKTWVYGITHNVVLTHLRSLRRKAVHHAAVEPETLVDRRPGPHDAASVAEAARIAHELLAQLSDEKRSILVLVDVEELSVIEAADVLRINLNTAYARLRGARMDLSAAVTRFHARGRRP